MRKSHVHSSIASRYQSREYYISEVCSCQGLPTKNKSSTLSRIKAPTSYTDEDDDWSCQTRNLPRTTTGLIFSRSQTYAANASSQSRVRKSSLFNPAPELGV